MGTLNTFLAELTAAQPDSTAVEVLRPVFRRLELSDDSATVGLHDALANVASSRRPLYDRLVDAVRLLERAAAAAR